MNIYGIPNYADAIRITVGRSHYYGHSRITFYVFPYLILLIITHLSLTTGFATLLSKSKDPSETVWATIADRELM
jgi:hypothetical protein